MNTLFNLLTLTLLVFILPSIQARKFNSNNGIFTVDLIHRSTLLSPQKLQNKLYNEKNDITSEITPSNGDYLMKIAIGNPSFEFMAIADTGSDLMWLQCSQCKENHACIEQKSPLFDPNTSSTYKPIDLNSPICNNPDLQTFPGQNDTNGECMYFIIYGDETYSIGVLSTDTITFSSSANLPSSVFGCGYAQNGSLDGAGIIGLGFGPSSLVSQLGPKINYRFSYCLAPLSSGATSKLTFGADLSGLPGVVSTPFKIKKKSHHYVLTLDRVNIGNSSIHVGRDVIIDSGTTLTYLEASVYGGIKESLKSGLTLSPMENVDEGPELCYETIEPLKSPDVVFSFKGAEIVLKESNVFKVFGNMTCLAMLPTLGKTFIFGNVGQVNFKVGYDLNAKRVSFVPTDCAVDQ